MEEIGGEINYPRIEQIVDVNRRMIKEFGGLFLEPDNLLNKEAVEYVVEAVASSIFGVELYPTIKEKACAIAYHIISRHVFNDGNKRTAAHIAWEFLENNDVKIILDESIIDLAIQIADGNAKEEQLLRWLHEHQ